MAKIPDRGSNSVVRGAIRDIKGIKEFDVRKGVRGLFDKARNYKIKRIKINKIHDLAKSTHSVAKRGIDAAKDISRNLIAADTAKDLANKRYVTNDNKNLETWTQALDGNPDTTQGQSGQSQTGSTTNLYNNELGGM